jgi:hypothetical protein
MRRDINATKSGKIKSGALLCAFILNASGDQVSHSLWIRSYNFFNSVGEMPMLKFLVVTTASLAMVTAAAAADLPHAQPVYKAEQAPIGKTPIGKTPIGKTPIGKTPIGKAPLATRG